MADKYEKLTADELYEIANRLYSGTDGMEQDYDEAARVMKIAADKGNVLAQCDYGVYLINGDGVEKDEEEAFEYWKKSAESEFPPAMHKLGVCYFKGICGAEQDNQKAFDYFTKAAEGGVKDSMFNLAFFYQEGICVAADIKKSLEWLQKAAEAKQPTACYSMGMHYLMGGNGIATDEAKGVEFLTVAAEEGIPEAQFTLGCCYESGRGIEKDFAEAAGWYRRSARAGFDRANESLKRLGFPGVK